jgi:acetyltransferase-like isoleucine patch superfamily enzyme
MGTTQIGIGSYSPKQLIVNYQDQGNLIVGKFCSIGSDVQIYLGGNHRTDWLTTHPIHKYFNPKGYEGCEVFGYPGTNGDVNIGNDVWIGDRVIIHSGVNIPDGVSIGSDSIVRKHDNNSLHEFGIYIGNPVIKIGTRGNAALLHLKLEIPWWDWPIEYIKETYPLLQSEDYKKVVEYFFFNKEKIHDELFKK